ncbi:hypothetical protein V5799_020216 [Amblyomma americanum]|uniref:Phytanoyl-CoA dioxygenase family protein n=1 Tax=Amblyomma americanum TaxID=6943 RepID=A0AAQ4EUI1_AMBAM
MREEQSRKQTSASRQPRSLGTRVISTEYGDDDIITNIMASVRLSDRDVEDFDRDGAVCLRDVFDDRWLELAREGIRKNIAEPGPGSEALRVQGKDGVYFNDYCNWRRIHELREYVLESPAKEIAGRLMRSAWAAFYHEHVLVKGAGTELETPWHQDQPYYPVDGDKVCSIWMPVDPVDLESTIQFVAGSHRWGKWFFPRKFATSRNYALLPSGDRALDHDYEDVPEVQPDAVLKWALQVLCSPRCNPEGLRFAFRGHGSLNLGNGSGHYVHERIVVEKACIARSLWLLLEFLWNQL